MYLMSLINRKLVCVLSIIGCIWQGLEERDVLGIELCPLQNSYV